MYRPGYMWKVTPFGEGPSFYISTPPNRFRRMLWAILGVRLERVDENDLAAGLLSDGLRHDPAMTKLG